MKRILALILAIFLWFSVVPTAKGENTTLVPCAKSPEFIQRVKNAPDTYYFKKPLKAYSRLLCGPEGLPHLPLDRPSLMFDILTPMAMFLYIAGFIGWTGRSYLIAARKSGQAEEKELFIDMPVFVACALQALLWPLAAFKELMTGELVAKDDEIPISVR